MINTMIEDIENEVKHTLDAIADTARFNLDKWTDESTSVIRSAQSVISSQQALITLVGDLKTLRRARGILNLRSGRQPRGFMARSRSHAVSQLADLPLEEKHY